jgi:iron complex outermembrane recepter protein
MKNLILLFLALIPLFGMSQKSITGTVINAIDGEGIPGVHIVEKGTNNGVVSDASSRFELKISSDSSTIIVTGMGFESQTIKVNPGQSIVINLQPTIYEIDQVVITASRDQEDRNDAPISMAIMKDARLKDIKAETTGQLLNKISSVHVADFGNDQQSISIRQPLSFGRTQLVILEDGVPLGPTSIATSSDIKDMNLSNIKSIEVLRGPTSSIYGSEAVGGVVNFITKNPSVFPTANIGVQQTNMGYTAIDFGAATTYKKVGFALNGIYAQRNDGYRVNTDMNKTSISGKIVYNITNKTKWSTSATYKDYYTDFAGSLDSVHFYTADTSNPYLINYADMKTFRAQSTLNHNWNSSSKSFLTFFIEIAALKNYQLIG